MTGPASPGPPAVEPLRDEASSAPERLSSILLVCVIGWAAFTALNGAQGRLLSASIDLLVTLGVWASRRWAQGRPERVEAAAHAGGAFNALGLAVVSLIQGQSAAMASWFLVASPLYAGFILGPRAARLWSAVAIALLGVVHLSSLFTQIKPEFVHAPHEVWGGAAVLVLAQLAFSLASLRAQRADIERLVSQKKLIQRQADELSKARDEAVAGARARDEFLALMSHEIRTPLHGILGFAELLATGDLPPEQRERAETIRASGEALRVILDDILDTAKIEAGKMAIEAARFDPSVAVHLCVELHRAVAEKKGLSLSLRLAEGLPPRLIGDSIRVRQVIQNLLSNAIKFTERGSVDVAVDRLVEGDRELVHVVVSDTGVGISSRDLDQLFQPFTQVDSSHKRRFEGTGLGLSICRRLARLMDGDVWAESQPGRGSSFHFSFALMSDEASSPRELAARPAAAALRVLLVEDNPVNRRVAQAMLAKLGHRFSVVEDGFSALEALEAEAFDVVLMDMRMPGMDGVEATRLIRASRLAERAPWIIAMTANASAADREACRAAGMDDFLSKPTTIQALQEALERVERGP